MIMDNIILLDCRCFQCWYKLTTIAPLCYELNSLLICCHIMTKLYWNKNRAAKKCCSSMLWIAAKTWWLMPLNANIILMPVGISTQKCPCEIVQMKSSQMIMDNIILLYSRCFQRWYWLTNIAPFCYEFNIWASLLNIPSQEWQNCF